jgi:Leucine-rich repeat (LRR) protein
MLPVKSYLSFYLQVRAGFQDLGKTADGLAQAYLTFTLSNTTANDLRMIPCGRHLQRLELGRNQLCDLSHISGMENLIYLNVSGIAHSEDYTFHVVIQFYRSQG